MFAPERIAAVILFVLLLCFGGLLIKHEIVCQSSTQNSGCHTLKEPLWEEVPDDGVTEKSWFEDPGMEQFNFFMMHKYPSSNAKMSLRSFGVGETYNEDANNPENAHDPALGDMADDPAKCAPGYMDFKYGCCEKWNSRCTAPGKLDYYDMSQVKMKAMCKADHERCEATRTTVSGRVDGASSSTADTVALDGEVLYGSSLPADVSGVTDDVLKGNFTIMATIFLDGEDQHKDGSHYGALFLSKGTCTKDQFYIGVSAARTIEFTWGEHKFDFVHDKFNVKTWYHVAIVLSSYKIAWRQWAQPLLYVDGQLVGAAAAAATKGWGPYEGTMDSNGFNAGGFVGYTTTDGPWRDLTFHGGMKNIEVYNTAVEYSQIANRAGAFAGAKWKRYNYVVQPGPYGPAQQTLIPKPCNSDDECENVGSNHYKCILQNRSMGEGADLPEHAWKTQNLIGGPNSEAGEVSKQNIKRCREPTYHHMIGARCGANIEPGKEHVDQLRFNTSGKMATQELMSGWSCDSRQNLQCVDQDTTTSPCKKCEATIYNEAGEQCSAVTAGTMLHYQEGNPWTDVLANSCSNGTESNGGFDLVKVIDVSDACLAWESTSKSGTEALATEAGNTNNTNAWKTIYQQNSQAKLPARKDSQVSSIRLHIVGPVCTGKNASGKRCETHADCTSNYCDPYVDSQSSTPWKVCGDEPEQKNAGCCKAGWTLVTRGNRGISHSYCCPPKYEPFYKMDVEEADMPTQDPPLWSCIRSDFGEKTLSDTQTICREENEKNENFTVGMVSINGMSEAVAYSHKWEEGFWTGSVDAGVGGKYKFVEEATQSFRCSDLVARPTYGPLVTASGVPVSKECQRLGCGKLDCLIAKYKCDSGTGLRQEVTYQCGSPENVADMGVAFLIFGLVIILLIVGLCVLPCLENKSKVVPA